MQPDKPKKQPLNDLDGRTWTRNSISVWNIVKTPEENRLGHPAMFPVELCKRLIEIYTKKGDVVLDPFMGSGTTLVAAQHLERDAIGFDVNPEFVALAKKRLSQEKLLGIRADEPQAKLVQAKETQATFIRVGKTEVESKLYCQDASTIADFVEPDSVDLVITSPPYWNIHTRKRTADYKDARPYSDLASDIGNIAEYPRFLDALGKIFKPVYAALKPGKRCIVIVMDLRYGPRFIPLHADVTTVMEKGGFILEDIIIWNRGLEYGNLRPLGYPYVFIVNKVHEYILIFRKDHQLKPEEELSEDELAELA